MSSITLDPANEFDSVLIKIKAIHDKKRADYSKSENRFSNFEYAAKAANVDTQTTFEVLIGIKQARLKELMDGDRTPQNEPIEDTLLDRAVYCILALAYYLQNAKA